MLANLNAGPKVEKTPPVGNLAVVEGKDVDPFDLKGPLNPHRRRFFPAQHGDVLACLDELPRLEGTNAIGPRGVRKKVSYLLREPSILAIR
jgi:hypothetical protein